MEALEIFETYGYLPTNKSMDAQVDNRVIGKVRKTQHQNPEFGHTPGDIKKNLQKSTIAFYEG
jgi:hypothetical protein